MYSDKHVFFFSVFVQNKGNNRKNRHSHDINVGRDGLPIFYISSEVESSSPSSSDNTKYSIVNI
jgi:hypothetical protein